MESNLIKKRIFHLTPSLRIGGVERQLLLTLPRLTAFEHSVICLQSWGKIGEELKQKKIDVHFISSRNPFSIRAGRAFGALVRTFKPDVLITYLPPADFFGRIWGNVYGIPHLVCFLRSTMRDWRYLPLILLNVASQQLVDEYFAVSRAVQDRHVRFGIKKNLTSVIYNGIDVQAPIPVATNLLESKLPRIGYIAQLRKERGHLFLFRALEQLLKMGDKVILTLVGDGSYRATLEQSAKQRGLTQHIEFLGQRYDAVSLLPRFTLYAHASLYEGMSVALLEAMRAGCAIITTDIPENREVLGSSACARLVPPNDVHAFACAMHHLLHNSSERNSLSTQAKTRVQTLFSIEKSTKIMTHHLHRVIDQLPSPTLMRRIFNDLHS